MPQVGLGIKGGTTVSARFRTNTHRVCPHIGVNQIPRVGSAVKRGRGVSEVLFQSDGLSLGSLSTACSSSRETWINTASNPTGSREAAKHPGGQHGRSSQQAPARPGTKHASRSAWGSHFYWYLRSPCSARRDTAVFRQPAQFLRPSVWLRLRRAEETCGLAPVLPATVPVLPNLSPASNVL